MRIHAPPSLSLRLAVLLLVVLALWLAQQAGKAGVAGIYGVTAATYQNELGQSHDPLVYEQLLSRGVEKINRASALVPNHPGFAVQVADLVVIERGMDRGNNPAQFPRGSIAVLHAALIDSPVRADLWWRLAREEYEVGGVNVSTSHAMTQALAYGPREAGSLLLNAMLMFSSGEQFDTSQRLRGWNAVVEAAAITSLEPKITSMARSAGKERQLRHLLQEKSRQQARLKVPEDVR